MLYFPSKNLENKKIGTTFYNSKLKNFYNDITGPLMKKIKLLLKKI